MADKTYFIEQPSSDVSPLLRGGGGFGGGFNSIGDLIGLIIAAATSGKAEEHEPMTKEAVKELLKRYSIDLGKVSNDVVYVANYGMAKLYTSSIADETHLAKYIKDVVADPDCPGGNVFARWYADMRSMGEPVDWDELL